MASSALQCSLDNKSSKSCVPCSSLDKTAVLSLNEVQNRIEKLLPLWEVQDVGLAVKSENADPLSSGKRISRSFVARNFQAALDAINAMGRIAEEEGHHPDFHLTSYRHVRINLFTHSLDGITENDLILAQLLDEQVPVDYSPKWLKEHPAAMATAKPKSS